MARTAAQTAGPAADEERVSPRILVVTPTGPEGPLLCDTLRGMRPQWEVLTATSAASALAVCGVLSVGVVVVDDTTDGAAALLSDLALAQPTVGRVALSQSVTASHSSQSSAPQRLAAHHILSRTPATYPLVRAISSARTEAAATRVDPVDRIVADLDTLPCAPLVWTRLRTMLAEPDSHAGSLADVICQDVAATALVLRIANAPGTRPRRAVVDVADAIRLVGLRTVSSALLAPQVLTALRHVRPLPGLRVHEVSHHGFACGSVARSLLTDPQQAAQAHLGGLLQDVGQLALATRATAAYRSCLTEAARWDRPLHEVERATLGFDHAQVGAALLRRWNLPESVAAAVGGSHQPSGAAERQAAVPLGVTGAVRLAHCLVTTRLAGQDPQERGSLCALAAEADALVAAHDLAGVCAGLGPHLVGALSGAPAR